MPIVKKHPLPANDPHLHAAQRMSCVSLVRPSWTDNKSLIIAGVVALGALFVGVLVGGAMPKRAGVVSPALAVAAKQVVPFDIKLNASALAPDRDAVAAIETVLPAQAILSSKALPPAMAITVDAYEPQQVDAGQDEAAFQAQSARQALRQGDVKQALRFQSRASVLAPENSLYRLGLAVLYDRLGDTKNAAVLYQQVVAAYQAKDGTLPHTLNISDIQRRLDYLTAAEEAP